MQLQPFQYQYGSLYLRLVQLWPSECDSQIVNMVYLLIGIWGARSVQTGCIAAYIAVLAKKMSMVRRLERFLDNSSVRVREWYKPIALGIIAAASVALEIHRVVGHNQSQRSSSAVDGRRGVPATGFAFGLDLGEPQSRPQQHWQASRPLEYVRRLIPAAIRVSLVGDCEFGHNPVLSAMQKWGWDYALRQSGQVLVQLPSRTDGVRLDSLSMGRDDCRFIGQVKRAAAHGHTTNLMLCWDKRCPEPWLLATNLTKPFRIWRLYHRRAWVESRFRDLKDNGFDFERSSLRHFLRLSRLTLAVCLLYVWFLAFGTQLVKLDLHKEVDRADHRNLSLFRIAGDYLQRALLWAIPFNVTFEPFVGFLPGFHPCGW